MNPQRFVILAAVDDTPAADLVVSSACAFASSIAGGELHLVHSVRSEANRLRELVALDGHGDHLDRRILDATRVLKRAVVGHLAEGDPATSIVQTAASIDADLVIVGAHDRDGHTLWMLGSVAEKVMARAACPVLVVRPKDHHAHHAPEIEPPCADCLAVQRETRNATLWCARHAAHHPRAHLHYEGSEPGTLGGEPLTGS